jgi:membrane protein DedA with SNARE-associated domain
MDYLEMHFGSSLVVVLTLVGVAFVSEDAGTVTAATLAAARLLDARLSFFSAVAGLWLGDLAVYVTVRFAEYKVERMNVFSRAIETLQSGSKRIQGHWPLAFSRFLPGTRLPAYVSAALNRMPFLRFAGTTAATAVLWTWTVFAAIRWFPSQAETARGRLAVLSLVGVTAFTILFVSRPYFVRLCAKLEFLWQKTVRWEFWPAWLFYAPVTAMCAWLGLRYRGLSLPTIANLNQKNGGIVGESKIAILQQLLKASAEATAESYLIPPGPFEQRLALVKDVLLTRGLAFPVVLKPDTAQRGSGFRKAQSLEDVKSYLAQVLQPLVLQAYVPGPNEAGIFYYRFPGTTKGEILGITRKRFPFVVGDGTSTIAQLIAQDDRARFLQHVYLKRLGAAAQRIPAPTEEVRLVEAGNHCQGCIFEDGADLYSEPLRAAVNEISGQVPGFYVGRFDIRYSDDESLRRGAGFRIIELNGAASEATHLYDARNSLWSAYRTLYRQWNLIYAIGAENRQRGARPRPVLSVWRDWRDSSLRACELPIAD